jgi:PEP-CTERM motif
MISSDNPQDFAGLPIPDGSIIEDPVNGTTVQYSLSFVSDTTPVPEPASLVLMGLGAVCATLGIRCHRRVK